MNTIHIDHNKTEIWSCKNRNSIYEMLPPFFKDVAGGFIINAFVLLMCSRLGRSRGAVLRGLGSVSSEFLQRQSSSFLQQSSSESPSGKYHELNRAWTVKRNLTLGLVWGSHFSRTIPEISRGPRDSALRFALLDWSWLGSGSVLMPLWGSSVWS